MKNRIAFITGASSGFGNAIARKFASNGYDIIINARRAEKLLALQLMVCLLNGKKLMY
jgi:NADP-dependent 3-hydroxy acid dehydrogenase YdfG